MVQDAERFKDEDDKARKKVDAKNSFEHYCFQVKNTLSDEKLKDKFSDEEKRAVEDIVNDGLQFLEGNTDADSADYEAKQKEIEAKFNPIMQKIYQQEAPTGPSDDMRGDSATHEQATVDDLD